MDATHFTPTIDDRSGAPLAVHGTALADAHRASVAPPQWVMLIPAGEFSGRDGRGPFLLTDPAAVIAATSELEMAAGLPVDYDHATDFAAPRGQPAPAAGWIRELAARDGALWGRVDWTPHGAMAITSREYRYISPVFQYAPDGEVTRLLRAGLTNNPNLYLTAISARVAAGASVHSRRSGETAGGEAKSAAAEKDKAMDTLLDELRRLLSLPDDASPEEVLEAVGALVSDDGGHLDDDDASDTEDPSEMDENAEDPEASAEAIESEGDAAEDSESAAGRDPAHYVTVAQFQKVLGELNRLRVRSAREQAVHAVDDAIKAGKLVPAQRQWAISYCQADVNGFAAFVARQPAVFGTSSAGASGFTSRVRSTAGALNRNETAICAQLGLNTEDYLRRKRAGRGDFLRLNHSAE